VESCEGFFADSVTCVEKSEGRLILRRCGGLPGSVAICYMHMHECVRKSMLVDHDAKLSWQAKERCVALVWERIVIWLVNTR
jgi:hypothetical protein